MRPLRTLVALLAVTTAGAQLPSGNPNGKKAYTQEVYDQWRTITGSALAPDGRFAAYTVQPVVGDGELILRSTSGSTEYRVARGWTGRPRTTIAAEADTTPGFIAQPAQFSADGKWAAVLTYATMAEAEAARRARRRGPEVTSMVLVRLEDGQQTKIARVRSFRFARDGGRFLAYQMMADSAAATPPTGQAARPPAARREPGTALILRDLAAGTDARIDEVTAFSFDEGEQWLGYTVTSRDTTKDGAFARRLATGELLTLASGRGAYRSLTFDRKGTQLAFVTDRDDVASAKPKFALYHAALTLAKGQKSLAPAKRLAVGPFGDSVLVADRGRVEFSRDGSALLFALMPAPRDSIPADSLAEKAIYDLWHWKDARTQPQQRLAAGRDRSRTWAAVYTIATGKAIALTNDSLQVGGWSDDGKTALVSNVLEHALEAAYGEGGSDYFLVNAATGARTPVIANLRGNAQLSPGARYVVFWKDGAYHAYSVATGKTVSLTAKIAGVRFDNVEYDNPGDAPPYGLGGWIKDDARVLINDQFDLWSVDPTGVAPAVNVTDGAGRARNVTFRAIDLDAEERFLAPDETLLLRAFNNTTKAGGFFRDKLGVVAAPDSLVMAARAFGNPQKARKTAQLLLTQQTYREFPDLWTGAAVTTLTKISNANPRGDQYPRGDVELVSWMSSQNVPLQGMLYKPEGFDPSKKYPMIVYYYERLSDGLYNYSAPSGRNTINPLVYNALGYLVFMPDIVYDIGYPGPSSAHAVIPGVQSLVARGFVDPKRVGLAGQSWGGYQTAYLITATNMFAAAVPNATVVNMTSAYGGIRWESGLGRGVVNYERGQSRIGGSLWEYPERYMENSPLFKLDRVTTPVLFMANDADGAVPWYQGIEFYLAMRRLKKEAYMVVYNGDAHNPTKRANQKDIDRKMQDFFAVHLLGAAPPDWMKNGIPYLNKGRDQIGK
ncbi:MAG: prolyl oligopeptidase family serine peptidase [Gemmatimonadaceae bacterium]|nr:prolyl oligopeptidase family serine peptidase [Gemmatimonadaceae bacterium]